MSASCSVFRCGLCCGQRRNYNMSVLLWTLIRMRELSADCSLHTSAARKHRSTTTLLTRKYILVPPLRKPNPSELESHTAYIERSDTIAVGNMGHGLLFRCNTNKQSVVFEQRNRQIRSIIFHDIFFGKPCRF